ncbi:TRAP transporter small permease [Halomonas chromatireducens]|uniref:TRAP transporter small permease protein n=1 Tax=Halomonas chromatireducens TaxID=507626 RepID=A0A109UKT6_9GAMM|nr:TRAP transporter small permease [Halomonas chromatireducens]AMC99418.1 2,3-diketo-L-gulonate TRAP transporter small permease protein YiaM [Halomonas chromatireducens]
MDNKKTFSPIFYLDTFLKSCLVAMMIAIASLTFYQVVMRYGFNKSSSWSEEAIRFIFIWCSFLAIAMGVREKIHIGINIIVGLFNRKRQLMIEIIGYLAIMFFSGHLVYYGWKVVLATRFQSSPALGIPMSWVYFSVPTMGALIFFYCLVGAINSKNNLKTMRKGP